MRIGIRTPSRLGLRCSRRPKIDTVAHRSTLNPNIVFPCIGNACAQHSQSLSRALTPSVLSPEHKLSWKLENRPSQDTQTFSPPNCFSGRVLRRSLQGHPLVRDLA